MKLRNNKTPLKSKIQLKLLQLNKKVYHLINHRQAQPKVIFFVVGCQRSGTTLLTRIFEQDFDTVVYDELHQKIVYLDGPQRLRLKPLDVVKRIVDQQRAPLAILKPLVETQNTLALLDYFDNSKGMWIYRHYQDVASSNLKNFGTDNGIKNLRPIVANEANNWRSERVSSEVRSIVLEHFSEEMKPHDAAALFWFVRNSLFFELNLSQHPKVMMCKYEAMVANPVEHIQGVYDFIGRDFPGEKVVAEVKSTSVGKGKRVELSPQIEVLCQGLLDKLEAAFVQKEYAPR